ncbi:MAG: hypothetical protein LBG22_02715, partial [Treponema sp.]|nr:hypothetical protein [Treponema sp.]
TTTADRSFIKRYRKASVKDSSTACSRFMIPPFKNTKITEAVPKLQFLEQTQVTLDYIRLCVKG